MSGFFKPNLSRAGRVVRGLWAVLLFSCAALISTYTVSVALALALAGGLALFEAVRGWCLVRACGIRTRI